MSDNKTYIYQFPFTFISQTFLPSTMFPLHHLPILVSFFHSFIHLFVQSLNSVFRLCVRVSCFQFVVFFIFQPVNMIDHSSTLFLFVYFNRKKIIDSPVYTVNLINKINVTVLESKKNLNRSIQMDGPTAENDFSINECNKMYIIYIRVFVLN